MIKADSVEEATELAKGCPILKTGGNVEIREVSVLGYPREIPQPS